MKHAKSSNPTHEEILEQAKDQKDNERSQRFLEIFEGVREEYESLLSPNPPKGWGMADRISDEGRGDRAMGC